MKLKRLTLGNTQPPPSDWRDRLLVLWEEDVALGSDREHTKDAFIRITGLRYEWPDHTTVDCEDCVYYIYRQGWVMSFDGGFVGILVKVQE